jgi:hypothetical protein
MHLSGRFSRMIGGLALTVCITAGAAAENRSGGTGDGDFDAQAEIRRLKAEVARLRANNEEDWLDRRRREEVKTLVKEVLEDAETRASLQGEGVTAGHDGDFFIASRDGRFRLELNGHLQVRYTFNHRDDSPGDDNQGGFNLRRAKFKPSGYIFAGDRRIDFAVSLAGDQDQGDPPLFEDYYLATPLSDRISVRAGRWKQPFALQNMRSSARQLLVERAAVTELFNVDRSEGAMLSYSGDVFRLYGSVNDGIDGQSTDFNEDGTEVALTGRAETLLAGAWDQFRDGSSWSGERLGAMLGGAVHYEVGESGAVAAGPDGTLGTSDDVDLPKNDFLLWTTDLSFEAAGLGVQLAGFGHHAENESAPNYDDSVLLAEAGYMVVPDTFEPFLRYEMIFADSSRPVVASGAAEEETKLLTAGFNWYHAGHDAKFTLDMISAFDPLVPGIAGPNGGEIASSSLGLQPDANGEAGQIAVRAQYQLKW